VLEWAVKTEARYLGMIGSRRKIQLVYASLKEKGVPAEKLERVHAPIGLDIGALTPEEIAVSIVAEMIQERRKGK
jgi:xanthine dehydrogenase accessory factor